MENSKDFYITITSRKYNTWQGVIVKGNHTTSFASELELLRLIDQYLQPSSQTLESESYYSRDCALYCKASEPEKLISDSPPFPLD